MDGPVADLEAIPASCARAVGGAAQGAADISTFVLTQNRFRRARLRLSAPVLRPTSSTAPTGSGSAPRSRSTSPAPGLVVVHGLFSTRRFDYVRETAVRAFFEWGFNVAAVDLRSFGLTGLMSDAPSSGGWKEGEDLIRVAESSRRWARRASARWGSRSGPRRSSAPLTRGRGGPRRRHPRDIAARRRRPGDRSSLPRAAVSATPPTCSITAFGRCCSRGCAARAGPRTSQPERGARPGERRLLRARRGGDPAPLLGRQPHRRRPGAGPGPASRGRQIIPVRHAQMLARRPPATTSCGSGSCPAAARRDRRRRRGWAYAVYRRFFERWAAYPDRDGARWFTPGLPKGRSR